MKKKISVKKKVLSSNILSGDGTEKAHYYLVLLVKPLETWEILDS